MELVIAALDDTDRVNRLSIAIGGRGAFRRFKDQVVVAGPNNSNGGTPSARTGSAVGLGRGWPARGKLPRDASQGRDHQVRALDGLDGPQQASAHA
jgi:hypothetical protein